MLGAIPYQPNEAVLHTDASLMPRRRAAWSSWNFHLSRRAGRAARTVTYWMNNLQRCAPTASYFVTLNRGEAIDPAKVIRRFAYDHPVYTARGRRRPGAPRRDQRRAPHPLLRRLLGLGLPRGRRRERAAGCERSAGPPARSRAACAPSTPIAAELEALAA